MCIRDRDRGEIVVRNPRADAREPPKSFFFDAVFGDRSAQERVYEVCGAPLVESVLQGYNGTIFAYGQVYIALLLVDVVADILGWWLRNAASRNQDTNALERAGGIYVQCSNIICSYVCMIPVSMYRRSIMINTYTQKSTIFFCSTWYLSLIHI